MEKLLRALGNGKILLSFFLVYVFFNAFLLAPAAKKMRGDVNWEALSKAEKKHYQVLDLRMSYSLSDVQTFFEKIGSEGKAIYRKVEAQTDMVYPIVYTIFFMSLLSFLLAKIKRQKMPWLLLVLLPIVTPIFDYLENINNLLLIDSDLITESMVSKGAFYTLMKWIFVFTNLGLALILLIIWIANLAKRKKV